MIPRRMKNDAADIDAAESRIFICEEVVVECSERTMVAMVFGKVLISSSRNIQPGAGLQRRYFGMHVLENSRVRVEGDGVPNLFDISNRAAHDSRRAAAHAPSRCPGDRGRRNGRARPNLQRLFRCGARGRRRGAFPRTPQFKEDIIQAFYDGIKHRPDTTFGNVKADVIADKESQFQRGNFCSVIRCSHWHG